MLGTTQIEKSILSIILNFPDTLKNVLDRVQADSFIDSRNKTIYNVIKLLDKEQSKIDYTTLVTALDKYSNLDNLGGTAYLSDIYTTESSSDSLDEYIKYLDEENNRLFLRNQMSTLISSNLINTGTSLELIDKTREIIDELTKRVDKTDFITIKQMIADLEQKTIRIQNGEYTTGLKSGFNTLDKKINGFNKGELIVLAARTGVGKSAMAINLCLNACIHNEAPRIALFSLEMGKEQLSIRLASCKSGVSINKIKEGNLDQNDWERFRKAQRDIEKYHIKLDDKSSNLLPNIRSKCRALKSSEGLDLVIIDYLQLVDPNIKVSSRREIVEAVSKGLKQLARELDIPIIALAQLSRQSETRGDSKSKKIAKPSLIDLRESGSIEQDADIVLFLWKLKSEKEEDKPASSTDFFIEQLKLTIAKNRQGESDVDIDVEFNKPYSKIYESEK